MFFRIRLHLPSPNQLSGGFGEWAPRSTLGWQSCSLVRCCFFFLKSVGDGVIGGIGVSGYLLVVMAFSGSSEMESNWRNFWGIFCWLVMLFFYCFIPLNCLTIPRLIWIGWFPYEIYWFYLYLRLWCFCLFLCLLEGGWGGVGGLTFFVLEFGLEGRCGGYCGCFGFQDLLSLDFQDHLRFGMTGPLKYAEQKHRSVCLDV